jgi:hypothetical protein
VSVGRASLVNAEGEGEKIVGICVEASQARRPTVGKGCCVQVDIDGMRTTERDMNLAERAKIRGLVERYLIVAGLGNGKTSTPGWHRYC